MKYAIVGLLLAGVVFSSAGCWHHHHHPHYRPHRYRPKIVIIGEYSAPLEQVQLI